jgi:molecular chaperone HscA
MPAGLARLEVTFRVDADGLLGVTARETTTGVEAKVEVKPSYGLTDEEVENMLLSALDHGEEDLEKRRLVEARVEAEQVLAATKKALASDADLLEGDERVRIEGAIAELEASLRGDRASAVTTRTRGPAAAWTARWRAPSPASRCPRSSTTWSTRPASTRTSRPTRAWCTPARRRADGSRSLPRPRP